MQRHGWAADGMPHALQRHVCWQLAGDVCMEQLRCCLLPGTCSSACPARASARTSSIRHALWLSSCTWHCCLHRLPFLSITDDATRAAAVMLCLLVLQMTPLLLPSSASLDPAASTALNPAPAHRQRSLSTQFGKGQSQMQQSRRAAALWQSAHGVCQVHLWHRLHVLGGHKGRSTAS